MGRRDKRRWRMGGFPNIIRMGAFLSGFLSSFDNEHSETGRYQFAGRMTGHPHGVYALSFAPDGRFLASGGSLPLYIVTDTDEKQQATVFASGVLKTNESCKYHPGDQGSSDR
jgi:WD40 repeat protein